MMDYILTGVIFIFSIEFLLSRDSIKRRMYTKHQIGWTERIIAILLWPVWLTIFLYNFFKSFFK